jgi:hypothetical protein
MTGFSGRDTALLLVALVFLHGVSAQTLRDDEQHLFAFLENVLPENSSLFNSSVPVWGCRALDLALNDEFLG